MPLGNRISPSSASPRCRPTPTRTAGCSGGERLFPPALLGLVFVAPCALAGYFAHASPKLLLIAYAIWAPVLMLLCIGIGARTGGEVIGWSLAAATFLSIFGIPIIVILLRSRGIK